MLNGRKRIVSALVGATLATAVGVGSVIVTTPASAKPSITDVQHRVDALYKSAEQASESYNQIHVQLKQLRGDVGAMRADQALQARRTEKARRQVADTMVRQYEGESLSAVGRAVVSSDPQAFVSQLTTMSAVNTMQATQYSDYLVAAKALSIRQDATQRQLSQVATLVKKAAADKAAINKKLDAAKHLLSGLKADQRDAIVSRGSDVRVPTTEIQASGRAATAVAYAMAQVGKAYVYGASGPSAYDCSGLTMRAWGAAGVGLPHSSSAQFGYGTRVSPGDLQPGDLVFYYSPISHVGMYIGNGLIVNAENPSAGVRVTGLYSMPFVGAVRPG